MRSNGISHNSHLGRISFANAATDCGRLPGVGALRTADGAAVTVREHPLQQAAQGVDVAAVVGDLSSQLLGRGVLARATSLPEGEPAVVGKPEVDDLGGQTVFGNQDIGRFQVEMPNLSVVTVGHGVQNLPEDPFAGSSGRSRGQPFVETLPIHVLHHNAEPNLSILLQAVHPHNMGVVKLHTDLVLLGEILATSGIVAILGRKTFQHIVTAETAGTIEYIALLPAPHRQLLVTGELRRQSI